MANIFDTRNPFDPDDPDDWEKNAAPLNAAYTLNYWRQVTI